MPGKTYIAALLTLPANGATPPHFHGNASIMGLMLRGALLNQFNDNKPQTFRPGEAWYEGPGFHHVRSENVGVKGRDAEEVAVYAVVVVDTEVMEKEGIDGLMTLDADRKGAKATGVSFMDL